MSDKKPPGTPPGVAPTHGSLEQEFEKFLRDEATPVGAIYRKLPQAEPDAQLDARVRALAHGALREPSAPALWTPDASTPTISTPAVSTSGASPARARRRWIPAFASAAVLVLAAGIAWRMGPQNNWTQKDTTSHVALDATATSNATATANGAPAPSVTMAVTQTQAAADTGGYPEAAKSTGAAEANRADATDAPMPFPPAKPATRIEVPAPSGGAPASSPQAALRKAEAEAPAAGSRSPGSPMPAREKSAPAKVDDARAELQPAPPADATAAPGAAESADRSTLAAAKARPSVFASPTAAPPPPPMQAPALVSGFAPEPTAASTAPISRPTVSTAGRVDEKAQKQSYADHIALPAGSPQVSIPGRPTAEQLAAWPAPNCRAAGTGKADVRNWNYPPDVPDSAQQRFVTVKNYLDLDSREGALKAYADFRHCYPDDRWPASLLRRLGTQ